MCSAPSPQCKSESKRTTTGSSPAAGLWALWLVVAGMLLLLLRLAATYTHGAASAAASTPLAAAAPPPTQATWQERQAQMLQTQQKVVRCLQAATQSAPQQPPPASYEAHKAHGDVARLLPVRLWQSTKPQPQQVLTVVTALSTQRLAMLESQCHSWPGPLVAVVYVASVVADSAAEPSTNSSSTNSNSSSTAAGEPLAAPEQPAGAVAAVGRRLAASQPQQTRSNRSLLQEGLNSGPATAGTERAVQETFIRMEALGPQAAACSLSVLLVTELVDSTLQDQLPINSMRNQAVLLVQTPLVAMLDTDLVVSRTLADALSDPAEAEAFVELVRGSDAVGRRLVVLPAFETLPFRSSANAAVDDLTHRVADFAQAADKAAIKGLMDVGLLGPFNRVVNPPGHAETDFKRWLSFPPNQADSSSYPIKPEHVKFEPWYIIDRQAALKCPYDEVFRGYGKNKIAHRLWMSHLGFDFRVHTSAFIVHRVHAESDAKLAWRKQMNNKGGPLNSLRLQQLLPKMQDGSYVPSLAPATAACMQQARQRHDVWRQQQQQQQQP